MSAKGYYQRVRDAVTGRFRSLAYALAHPRTTIVEKVKRK